MNKKKYIEPEMKTVKIRNRRLLSGSPVSRQVEESQEEVSSFDDLL